MDFSFIIVTYHNENTIAECLNSIFKHTKAKFEIIVVDNSENNLTIEKIKKFPVATIVPGENIGFAAGCNEGFRKSRGNYLIFLNPDAILLNDVASILKNFYETHKKCGVAGPQFYSPETGKIDKTCRKLPTYFNTLLYCFGLDRFTNSYLLNFFPHNFPAKVEQVIGACFFVKRELFEEFGGFDERFFIYFEEVDFCKRVIDSGLEVWFYPEAKVQHIEGVSCESENKVKDMIVQLRKSRLLYFEKHFGKKGKFFTECINKVEGIFKGTIFYILSIVKKNSYFKKKASGYFKVAFTRI